jgi:selenide,water dikinase
LLVQTVDFFTPIVDDPYLYGQVAAANSLSDVYAMGGRPVTAMNIVCFPTKTLGPEILNAILRGGADKVAEAGAIMAGGHTVEDKEPKYGLAVTGLVLRQNLLTRGGAQVGDRLVLTKPLGTGIVTTAHKRGLCHDDDLALAVRSMARLNADAAAWAARVGAHGGTDITGFGLLGHAMGLADDSEVTLRLQANALPVFPAVASYLAQGCFPGGSATNLAYFGARVQFDPNVSEAQRKIMADAQTSGGLLLSVPDDAALDLDGAVVVGAVEARGEWPLVVES